MSADRTSTDDEQLGRMLFATMKESYEPVELLASCIGAAAGFLRRDHAKTAKGLLVAAEEHLVGLAKLSPADVDDAVEKGNRVATDAAGRFLRKDGAS